MKKKILGAVIFAAIGAGIGLAIKHIIDTNLCDCEDCDESMDFDEFEDETDVEEDNKDEVESNDAESEPTE